MKRILLLSVVVAIVTVCTAGIWAGPQPTTQPTTQPSSRPQASVQQLKEQGMALALSGSFSESLDTLRQAQSLSPEEKSISQSVELLERYAALRKRMDKARQVDYQRSVQRVKRAMMVDRYQQETDGSPLAKKLRDKFEQIMEAYNGAGTINDLREVDTTDKARKLRDKTLKAIDKSAQVVQELMELLKDDQSQYAQTFRQVVNAFVDQKRTYQRGWLAAPLDTPQSRQKSVSDLWAMEYDLALLLGDIEAMIEENPWRTALGQAALAKNLATDPDAMMKEKWFQDAVELIRKRAKESLDKKEWVEALAAYSGLSELFPSDEQLREMVKDITRNVRFVSLYGKDKDDNAKDQDDEEKPVTWQELVIGADADLTAKVIGRLGDYVSKVEYRKVVAGGLKAVRSLAETSESADAFEKLKDKKLRDKFIKAIDTQLADVNSRDRVSQMDLQLALNAVLRASQYTVQIPTSVLVVEYTEGMLNELDKFSSVIWPYDEAEFQKQIGGEFIGVGIQIVKEPKKPLKVVAPLDDTPAFRAGIKGGDLIIAVDGKDTKNLPINRLVRMIMGKEDTTVVLRIKREGAIKPFDVKIVREKIVIKTVKGWKKINGGWDYMIDPQEKIGYVRVTQFTKDTADDLKAVLKQLSTAGVRSLVLDLRFNPGGRLDAAIEVADEFLSRGRIVSTKGLNANPFASHADSRGAFQSGDLVVLVNEQSASASEIVSGALQDLNRGLIVGQRSYGKGSVQKVFILRWNAYERRPEASLKLTTSYYYLPSLRLLHRKPGAKLWGVDPNVKVPLTPRQMRRWLEIRRQTDLRYEMGPDLLNDELSNQLRADLQLNTALLLLKLQRLKQQDVVASSK